MPAQPNLSLINGLACLQELVASDGPVGSRELARRLGLEATRVNRLLGTLAQLGLAEQDEARKYRPGAGVHVLAAQSLRGSRLLHAALPEIRELLGTGLAVALGVLWRDQVCYLYHGRGDGPVEAGIASHNLFPASQSSIGLVLQGDAAARRRGYVTLRPDTSGASLGVPIGDPPYAGLALAGSITTAEMPALAERLREAAARIAASTVRRPA
jgi:DNA-binding IclR family transcriptional regulator